MVGVGLVPGQHVGEPGSTAGDAGSDGAGRDVENGRDLGIVESGYVPEHDRGAELIGYQAESGVDIDGGTDRLRRVARGGAGDVGVVGVLVVGEARIGAATATTKFVETGVGGDAVGPGGEAGPAVEPSQPLHDGDHRLLGGVQRIGVVARETTTDRVDPTLVIPQQIVERALVPRLGRFDQRCIVDGVRDGVETTVAGSPGS